MSRNKDNDYIILIVYTIICFFIMLMIYNSRQQEIDKVNKHLEKAFKKDESI